MPESVAAGAEIIESPVDQGYGVREYGARDPEGQLWFFHAPLDRDDLVVLDRAAVSQNSRHLRASRTAPARSQTGNTGSIVTAVTATSRAVGGCVTQSVVVRWPAFTRKRVDGRFVPITSSDIAYDCLLAHRAVPVLFIHAGIADRRMWDPQWTALTNTCDLARLDLRGFGESDRPPAGPLSHVDDVIAMMDHAGLEKAHLVGASLGSGVAIEVALTVPSRVASLFLGPPGGSLIATRTDDLKAFAEEEDAALNTADLDAAVEANVRAWVLGTGRSEAEVDAGVVAAVRRMQRRAFEIEDAWGDVQRAERTPAALEQLKEITQPTLILVGGFDLDATKDAAQRLSAEIRHVKRNDWPDAAHLPNLEHPERFTDLLRGWLAEQTPSRTTS